MKIRCIAIDDEPMALDKLKNYIERVPYMELVGLCDGTYEAMQVLSTEEVDAMFIDINMPDMNGLEFVKSLTSPPMTVFTTAYADYALDSYKVHAVDYLLKPFNFDDFQRMADNLKCRYEQSSIASGYEPSSCKSDVLYLKVDYRYVKVKVCDIIYIEGMNEYLKIHQVGKSPFLTHTTFKQIKECLPDNFIQVHRSYVVNMNHVNEVERSVVLMSDGTRISISDSNKDNFMQYIQERSIRK